MFKYSKNTIILYQIDYNKMQIKKIQVEIMNIFRRNIFLSKTIREISIIAKKDYPNIFNAVKELSERNIIKIRKVGKSNLCEISLSKASISFLSYLDEQEALSIKIPLLYKILEFKEFLDDIILVTGSYAKKKETKESDIDLVFITKNNAFNKQKLLNNLTSLFLPKYHVIVITYKDFIDMLLNNELNFGNEIFNNKLLFRGAERYYELLKEAKEHGFRG